MKKKSFLSIVKQHQILNSCSHSDGANFGESQIVQTMIWHSTRTYQKQIWHTLMIQRMKNTFHMLLNHHLVQTVLHLHSFARHMMKKRSEKEMSEPLCIFILRSHRLRLRCFRYQRSYQNRLQRFIQTFARNIIVNLMSVVISVRDTAVRMRSVHHTASHTTLIP